MSNKVALVYDNGLYPYVATVLAKEFDTVYYFTPYNADAFPVFHKAAWGTGLPGVTRVRDFFDHVDGADLIVFPDIGMGDLQMWLRAQGHVVWGSGGAEVLEQDRMALKRLMRSFGMNMPPTWLITGMTALQEHLKAPKHENQYVKLSEFRGDVETFKHRTWWQTEEWWHRMYAQFGPLRETLDFVLEAEIEGAVEVGIDDYCVDGLFPATTMYGYERKDTNYLGRVVPRAEVPEVLTEVSERLGPVLKELGCRSMFSTEVRVTEDGVGYLIDPSARCPSPPSEGLLEMYRNWPAIMLGGAVGEMVEPDPIGKYVAEIVVRSGEAEKGTLALRFPEEYRPLVKLHGHALVDGVDYVVCLGMDVIGACVGVGDTQADAIEMCVEVAESLEGGALEFDEHGFEELEETIEKGVKRGINWE